VFVVPASGGQERKLAEISEVSRLWPEAMFSFDLDWSPDGRFLAVPGRSPDGKRWSIYSVSLETGQKRPLTTSDSPIIIDRDPAFSPDGRRLAFLRGDFAPGGALLMQPLSNEGAPAGLPKPIAKGFYGLSSVSWMPGGQELVVGPDLLVSATGSRSRSFRLPASNPFHPQVRGTRLAFADVGIREKMFRVTLTGGRGDQPAPFLSSTRDELGPAFSPDGRRVAFESWRSGVRPVWICNTDGSGCHELSSFYGDDFAGDASWSPDGRRLAFAATHREQFHVYICAAEGGTVRRLTSDWTYDARPRWSRDGQWIYFGSTRSGGWEIWKTRADSADADATAIRITREGGIEATESPDGRYLYYAKRETSGIWRLPLGGSGDVREEKVLDLGGEGRWSLRPDGIFLLDSWPARSPAIRFFNFATGRVSDVVTLPSDWYFILSGGAFAVSPDGTWAIVTQERLTESDIMLVENFR